ncbi:MAG: hydrolase [bacterium]
MQRHPQILRREHAALLVVDVQQKIAAVMRHKEHVVENIVKLIKACSILNVPILVSEQYPQGLGSTITEIAEALGDKIPLQKMTFSCCHSNELMQQLKALTSQQVIVTGIESHVCVLQTALDLIANNFQVQVPRDAVSSRKKMDYKTALERLSHAGAVITSVEAVLFELLEKAGTPEFKEVTKLIK